MKKNKRREMGRREGIGWGWGWVWGWVGGGSISS